MNSDKTAPEPSQLAPGLEQLAFFASDENLPMLADILRGIEKEGLRSSFNADLALTPHPASLGSALTNSWLTTDFSESLLEFITPTFTSIDSALEHLATAHSIVSNTLGDEMIWASSMPCRLPEDSHIPLAQYGSSNIATMKTVYRRGLANRYGRAMQTVAGIHYNFSMPQRYWEATYPSRGSHQKSFDLQAYINARYFDLVRNFRRNYWLLIYLFGAAPCIDRSFVQGRNHHLDVLNEQDFYLPNATSLRMGDLGYQSAAQQSMFVCYNELDTYIETLGQAIKTPYPEYEKIGMQVNGEYQQLSTALLQIENEFYSPIRPKRVTASGEKPLQALDQRGVQYIEVRCLDLNPFDALGINAGTIRFLDAFLLHCLLHDSPLCNEEEFRRININQSRVVNEGRDPDLSVFCGSKEVGLRDCANRLLEEIGLVAQTLDRAQQTGEYTRSVADQQRKVEDASLTPSAQVLHQLQSQQLDHLDWVSQQSLAHRNAHQSYQGDPALREALSEECRASQLRREQLETQDQVDFAHFLHDYFAS